MLFYLLPYIIIFFQTVNSRLQDQLDAQSDAEVLGRTAAIVDEVQRVICLKTGIDKGEECRSTYNHISGILYLKLLPQPA